MNDMTAAPAQPLLDKPLSRYRWVIVSLLFAACTINYVDRQMIGVLKPTLSKEMGWTEEADSNSVANIRATGCQTTSQNPLGLLRHRIGSSVMFKAPV